MEEWGLEICLDCLESGGKEDLVEFSHISGKVQKLMQRRKSGLSGRRNHGASGPCYVPFSPPSTSKCYQCSDFYSSYFLPMILRHPCAKEKLAV